MLVGVWNIDNLLYILWKFSIVSVICWTIIKYVNFYVTETGLHTNRKGMIQ